MLFVNGTNDRHNWLDAWQRTHRLHTLAPHTLQATVTAFEATRIEEAPPRINAAEVLAAGIADITNSMVESFKLNEVLRMILETMFRALGFRRVVFCLRDPKTDTLTGRFGLGEGADAVAAQFRVPLKGGSDLFSAVCAKGADTLITCGAPQSNHCRITLAAAVKEGLKCRFVIEERVAGSFHEDASGNHFMFRLLGVEAITVVPGGSNMAAAMQGVADELAAQGRKGYIIAGGGSNALGGLGYVACAQELQQQLFDQGVRIDRLVVGSGSSGTHGGLVAGFLGNHIQIPIVGVGVSRDPADQQPLVMKEAQAVADLLGLGLTVKPEDVTCVGGYWQPK